MQIGYAYITLAFEGGYPVRQNPVTAYWQLM
jgi:hypothetical protein